MKNKFLLLTFSLFLFSFFTSCDDDEMAVDDPVNFFANNYTVVVQEDNPDFAQVLVTVESNLDLVEVDVTTSASAAQATFMLNNDGANNFSRTIILDSDEWDPGVFTFRLTGEANDNNVPISTGDGLHTETITFGGNTGGGDGNTVTFQQDSATDIGKTEATLIYRYSGNTCSNCTIRVVISSGAGAVVHNEEYVLSSESGTITIDLSDLSANTSYGVLVDNIVGETTYGGLPQNFSFTTDELSEITSITLVEDLVLSTMANLTLEVVGNPEIGGSVRVRVADPSGSVIYDENESLGATDVSIPIGLSGLNPSTAYTVMVTNIAGATVQYDNLNFSETFTTFGAGVFDADLDPPTNKDFDSFDITTTFTNSTPAAVDAVIEVVGSMSGTQTTPLTLPIAGGINEITTSFSGMTPAESVTVSLLVGGVSISSQVFTMDPNEYTSISYGAGTGAGNSINITPNQNVVVMNMDVTAGAASQGSQVILWVKPDTATAAIWERTLTIGVVGGNSVATVNSSDWITGANGYVGIVINYDDVISVGMNTIEFELNSASDDDTAVAQTDSFLAYATLEDFQGNVIEDATIPITVNFVF